jgi:hypothetical protein
MACEINASPSNGLVQSADGSGVIKLKSNGVTTNALAWVNFNGTGTVAIRSSYNVSSITDNGTGDYTVNFATALSDANYVVNIGAGGGNTASAFAVSSYWTVPPTASLVRFRLSDGTNAVDREYVGATIHGN